MIFGDGTKAAFLATSPRFNYFKEEKLLGEVPGPGAYERMKSQEEVLRTSVGISRAESTEPNTAGFLGKSGRDDYLSYLADKKRLPSMGPAAYHQTGRPFLKKSFNASLPPAKFY